jgi:phosphate transport system protein
MAAPLTSGASPQPLATDSPGATPHEHISETYEQELKNLQESLMEMGSRADLQLEGAIQSVTERDEEIAARVVEQDAEIDALGSEIEENVVRLLALRQPVARDLRQVISALKIVNDLERIGDYSKNIAKRAIAINDIQIKPSFAIPRMGILARDLIRTVLESLATRDVELALSVWERDEELDEMNTSLFRELLTYMMEDPRSISAGTHLLFMAKNIERIGDHATNIAETVIFMVTGKSVQENRPKNDASSSTVT